MNAGIGRAEELPLRQLPDEPFWSENYYLVGHDSRQSLSVVIHVGRWSKDPSLWREQVLIFLPDATYALAQNVGFRPSENGLSGALLDMVCEEPGRCWRFVYRGPARPTTQAELYHDAPLRAAPMQLLDIDLRFESEAGIWDFGNALKGESWVSFHYEQPGKLGGTVSVGDQTWRVEGIAHRDHSRGPRRYSGIEKGVWMQAHFPGGRTVAVLETAFSGKGGKRLARVFEGGKTYEATCSELPSFTGVQDLPVSMEFTVTSELGEMTIQGKFERGLPKSFDDRNEVLYGMLSIPGVTAMQAIVGPVSFNWNGQQGWGHVDLCRGP